jgi:hypothetical protein
VKPCKKPDGKVATTAFCGAAYPDDRARSEGQTRSNPMWLKGETT